MEKPVLIYDGNCFICSNYVRLLKMYIPADKLDYEAMTGDSDEVSFKSSDGTIYQGQEAVDMLAKEVPETLSYFGMLPYRYRQSALQTAYNIGSAVRSIIKRVSGGGCNCGKK